MPEQTDKPEMQNIPGDAGQTAVRSDISRRANQYFFAKVAVNFFLMILGAVLITVFLRGMQGQAAIQKQKENSERALSDAVTILSQNNIDSTELSYMFHDGNQDMLDDLSEMFKSGLFDYLINADADSRAQVFADVVSRSGVDYLFSMDNDGNILIAPNRDFIGRNLEGTGLMTHENLLKLISGTKRLDGRVIPIQETNTYGSFYFYSMPYTYQGNTVCMVLGSYTSDLDVQIASLKDVSVVLKRVSVGNDGFLFAVDAATSTFLYYERDGEVLTGKNALEAGLSAQALNDGYAGMETINGKRYYCVSRTFGGQTVICAAADTSTIHAKDRYVLFWSITGFIMVMLICLAYAVIVRNDFVRNATKTERKTLFRRNGKSYIFDKSIFKKTFPLMIAGVIVIFFVSFYTQTLLEISESIDDSVAALDEVAGRYEESLESRSLIKDYYDERFAAKAKLMAYLVEVDPAVLNETTSRRYTEYDQSGAKHYILDGEGNPLRSVSSSKRLQDLCAANDLESIYIFDENGRTIATSTPNWFFTISHNSEAQSYPFLEVLDGKTDLLIQDPMMSDVGVNSQYIGVAMNYYTTTDEDGDTRYVSHYEYDIAEALAAAAEAGEESEYSEYEDDVTYASPITEHRSLLQIGLKPELSAKLFASTDLNYIFSTDMLSGGFIVLFDNSADHLCLYSPYEARIGMKAADIGVPDKAFSGAYYYGFTRVNGIRYFQYFRFSDGYFVATAIPKADMFRARFPVSLITALVSLILIMILSGTVTLTTDEEEELYATMSDSQAQKGLNSTIFRVILPSGHTVSTTKAAARWDNSRVPWREKGPEQKLLFMVGLACSLLVVYVAATVLGANSIFDDGSVIHYILSGDWDRGPNVFALSASMLVLISTAILVYLFRIPVRLVSSLLGARGETIGHLLLSIVKYGGAIGALFYCLYLFGVDSRSLLASAGVLTLVIGLGAQSLIKDILAGIFIVFEGEFRVGDIVTINGFRGTVMDIGLRTTKILDVDNNIKIYNNSEISGVLNMTKEASFAYSEISVEYGQDIDYVEEVLKRELPALADKNPLILRAPESLGVQNLGDSGVTLLIYTMCEEKDVRRIRRFVNKEVLKIFYRNGINVPFPNVTVSHLNMEGRKTMADLEAMDAEKAAAEAAEVSEAAEASGKNTSEPAPAAIGDSPNAEEMAPFEEADNVGEEPVK
ncbi:MAG: mechanosensitive ion channel family protein [Firmicutes bacterium]|nr:mechanosensitive ion channel family protein [Bacillota bacterium]